MRLTKRHLYGYLPSEERKQLKDLIDFLIKAIVLSETFIHPIGFPVLDLKEIASITGIPYWEVKEYFEKECLRRATYAAMVKY